jgi:hypothetical protein
MALEPASGMLGWFSEDEGAEDEVVDSIPNFRNVSSIVI